MRKPGDIEMIFGNPLKCTCPVGQAKLIEKISEISNLEQWHVEYINNEGYDYIALLKKS